jgi:microcompartment protein CcmK/EutM
MRICRVVGIVVAAKSVDRLNGPTYLMVEPAKTDGTPDGGPMVAVDAVQAGAGDLVLVTQGSSCRQLIAPDHPETPDTAVDALVIGVIDLVDERGIETYRSGTGGHQGATAS